MNIVKTWETERCKRWALIGPGKLKYFPSKRAAECWARTGEKFKTNPQFPVENGRRGTKRIR